MTLISIKKTAVVEPAPTGTVSVYVDAADGHTKQVDEAGVITDFIGDGGTSNPNAATVINTTLETFVVDILGEGLISPKACYRITDAAQGVIRVFGLTNSSTTATAMLEGSDDGAGTVTQGQWGNYDLDADVFTSVLGVEGNSQITNGAVYSQGDPSGVQSKLTFGEDFTLESIDNNTGSYSKTICQPASFEFSTFNGSNSKRIFLSSYSGYEMAIRTDLVYFVKFSEDGGDARIGFFSKFGTPSAQSSAIANATTAVDVITQFNTLLAAMRAYGLIAE